MSETLDELVVRIEDSAETWFMDVQSTWAQAAELIVGLPDDMAVDGETDGVVAK